MAYTYDDFLRTASAKNMLGRFDKEDLKITRTNPDYGLSVLRLMQDQDNANTPEAKLLAGEALNQLRANVRPVAGTDGPVEFGPDAPGTAPTQPETEQKDPSSEPGVQDPTTSAPAGDASDGGSFTYDQEDEYQKLLDAITNPGSFRYNHEKDPNWGAYRKTYLREGERATQDALARASAATGGIPSTYAITAAQQAGANYADQLAALIPTLEQNAYNRYLNQQDMQMNALQMLQADRENEYAKYLAEQELALKQQNAENWSATAGSQVEDGDLAYLRQTYPTGTISSKSTWEYLVSQYGEAALLAAGFQYQGGGKPQLETPAKGPAEPENVPVYFDGVWNPLAQTEQLVDNGSAPAIKDANPNYNGNKVDLSDLEGQGNPTFDESEILGLGLGPLSAEDVIKLIEAGVVQEYIENGQIKLRLNTHAPFFAAGAAIRKP